MAIHNESELETYICEYLEQHGWLYSANDDGYDRKNAIFPEDDVPGGQEHFIALNAELTAEWPVITTRKDPLPDAKEWDGKPNKLPLTLSNQV